MEVFPIAITQIDWPNLIRNSQQSTGRSIIRHIDVAGQELANPSSYLGALGRFENPNSDLMTTLRSDKRLLSHLFFGFYIEANLESLHTVAAICGELAVIFNDSNTAMILSGKMNAWRDACEDGMKTYRTEEVRAIFNRVFYFFEQCGLRDVWFQRTKSTLADGTFTLK